MNFISFNEDAMNTELGQESRENYVSCDGKVLSCPSVLLLCCCCVAKNSTSFVYVLCDAFAGAGGEGGSLERRGSIMSSVWAPQKLVKTRSRPERVDSPCGQEK